MATVKLTEDVQGRALPCEYVQLDEKLVNELNILPEFIEYDWDAWGLVFGIPGAGKSHWMQRAAFYLNAGFSLDDIVFTPEQFDEWVNNARPGDVCVFDEADVASSHHQDKKLRSLVRNSKRMRDKNLYVLMGTPTMKDMSPFFIFRARFITYCYAKSPKDRGWYHYYSGPSKPARLFAAVKKAYAETPDVYHDQASTIKNGYIGRSIPADWPIDKAAYDEKKDLARRAFEDDEKSPRRAVTEYRHSCLVNFFRWHNQKFGADPLQADAAAVFDVSQATISKDLQVVDWS